MDELMWLLTSLSKTFMAIDVRVLRSACVLCNVFFFSLSCLSVFLFAPLLGRCSLADSTANHHSDVMMFCQSADVPAVFEDSSWLCVCAPCQRTLCSNAVSGLCSTPVVPWCLTYLVFLSHTLLLCWIPYFHVFVTICIFPQRDQ